MAQKYEETNTVTLREKTPMHADFVKKDHLHNVQACPPGKHFLEKSCIPRSRSKKLYLSFLTESRCAWTCGKQVINRSKIVTENSSLLYEICTEGSRHLAQWMKGPHPTWSAWA